MQVYNAGQRERKQLPDYNRKSTLGLLIGTVLYIVWYTGNSRALWTPFIEYLSSIDYKADTNQNPLDSYE